MDGYCLIQHILNRAIFCGRKLDGAVYRHRVNFPPFDDVFYLDVREYFGMFFRPLPLNANFKTRKFLLFLG